jgi:hypothetical protein
MSDDDCDADLLRKGFTVAANSSAGTVVPCAAELCGARAIDYTHSRAGVDCRLIRCNVCCPKAKHYLTERMAWGSRK